MCGVRMALLIPATNTITPTHRLLINLPSFVVEYPYTHGEMKVQMPSRLTSQLRAGIETDDANRIAARITMTAPMIQLFQALGDEYAP